MMKIYWSTLAGNFVNKQTGTKYNLGTIVIDGVEVGGIKVPKDLWRVWNETLIEEINSISNLFDKTLNCNMDIHPEAYHLITSSVAFKENKENESIGKIMNRIKVFKNPKIKTNLIKIYNENEEGWIEILDFKNGK